MWRSRCHSAPIAPAASRAPALISVDSILAGLTVRQKAAQLVMPWISGAYAAVDDSDFQVMTRWVDSLQVGGVLVSVGSPFDIAAKLNALQLRSQPAVARLGGPRVGLRDATHRRDLVPDAHGRRRHQDPRDAYAIAAAAATEGAAVGIHVNFAPDADSTTTRSTRSSTSARSAKTPRPSPAWSRPTCAGCKSTACSPRSSTSPATATRAWTRT